MFTLLLLTTLPLFGLVFVGFALGKFSLFNNQDAKVFLKLIGILVVPTLGIKIIGEFNYQHIKWDLYFLYLVSQFLIYFTGFFIAKLIFMRSNAESLIIGMTSAFSNHLFFVYPMALFEFATKDIVPIETIISADFITVGLSVCALDVATQKNIKKIHSGNPCSAALDPCSVALEVPCSAALAKSLQCSTVCELSCQYIHIEFLFVILAAKNL